MVTRNDIHHYCAEQGFHATPQAAESLLERLRVPRERYELWHPKEWLPLSEVLHGWDLHLDFPTQTDGPYRGPRGMAFANDAAEGLLCMLTTSARSPNLDPTLLAFDPILGSLAPWHR